ncbi:helix-turn-helix transcriptional regulator [Arthrobacter sp. AETb3-4]|uniref:Helix-turn-helix transcriptional regulator n=1 Tax=Arthrobacter wenxiniae TaxID=2713570 RepID=A0A7Y7M0R2_9MICC|nr:helix-turn-helix transcriptional regulator [Arthrobacter wenxiniae]
MVVLPWVALLLSGRNGWNNGIQRKLLSSKKLGYPLDTQRAGFIGNVLDPDCPSRLVFARIGDKWAALVIQVLADGPLRFSQLRTRVHVVTPKVLTQVLRSLERDGLLTRTVFAQVPPRVDYELTPLGRTLLGPLSGLRQWAESNAAAMLDARDAYDERADAAILQPGGARRA